MRELTKEKKSQLEDFQDLISDWLWEIDADQNLVYSNNVIEAHLKMEDKGQAVHKIGNIFAKFSSESPHINKSSMSTLYNTLSLQEGFKDLLFLVSDNGWTKLKIALSARVVYDAKDTYAGHRGVGRFIRQDSQNFENKEQMKILLSAVEHSPNGVMITNADGVIEYANPGFSHITGYSRSECYGQTPAIISSGRTSKAKCAEIWDAISQGRRWSGTVYNKRKNGDFYWCRETVSPIKRLDGTVSNYIAIQQDVTCEVEAGEALRESQERFRYFAEAASDWYWETDSDLRFTFISDSVCRYSSLDMNEIIGMSRADIVTCTEDMLMWQGHLQDLEARRSFKDFTYTFIRTDLEKRRWQISGKPIYSNSQEFLGYRGVGKDITVRTDLEGQLRQAQKMEVIGHLTGGIAHDFNNLLAIIMGNAELLAEDLSSEELGINKKLETILFAAKSGANITSQLLMFSKKQPLTPVSIRLDEQFKLMEHILRSSMGDGVSIRQDFVQNLWPSFVDPDQFANAVLNLFMNARDAMDGKGCLTITLLNETIEQTIALKDLPKGEYVSLVVGDNGSGILPEILEKIYEPFYTTKEIGKGTGLGLSMVYGFVKKSGGAIWIESDVGLGTRVHIYLPRYVEADQ